MTNENARTFGVSDEELGAYLDGELDEARRTAVEAYLAANPRVASFVEGGARVREGLHGLFDGYLNQPLPAEQMALQHEIERRMQRARSQRLYRRLVAAAVALFAVVGAGLGAWHMTAPDGADDRLFALFSDQHGTSAPAGQGTAPAEQGATAQLATLGSETAAPKGDTSGGATAPNKAGAPDFSSFGYNLIGTRLLATQDGGSMQLIYESTDGSRVELFFSPSKDSARNSLTLMEEGPISVLFWHAGGRSYSLVGEVGRDRLLELGRAVNGDWTIELPKQGSALKGSNKQSDRESGAPASQPASDSLDAPAASPEAPAAAPDGTVAPDEIAPAETTSSSET